MKSILFRVVAVALVGGFLISAADGARQRSRTARRPGNKGAGVPKDVIDRYEAREFEGRAYRFLGPQGYDASKKYPLILSLHGAGGTGDDNISSLRDWNAIFVDSQWRAKYQCFVIVPQTSSGWRVTGEKVPELSEEAIAGYSKLWQARIKQQMDRQGQSSGKGALSAAFELVASISKEYSIDTDRIYVLGHSMGGFGSWNAICMRPDMFAAAIPSAGGLEPWKDWAKFAKVPIWTFHGAADKTVPTGYTREIFARMKELGSNTKFTELKGVGHSVQKQAFSYTGDDGDKGYITSYASGKCDRTADVWQWLFKQKRGGD